jgi:predicted house-cleaning noncanonical NTP pyrophosphatase (MazG superfamily)
MNNLEYIDGYNYSSIQAPESTALDSKKISAENIINKYNFNNALKEELLEDIEHYVQEEIKNATLEFVNRFFQRLGTNKLGYTIARSLGFHIYLKDKEGKEIHTQKEIAKYFDVCPQMIDLLSKQVQEDLKGIEPITSMAIHKKNYNYNVIPPEGFYTTIQVMKMLNLTNKKLNGIVKVLDIKKKNWCRGSRLITESDVDKIELYLMEGK